MIYQEMIDFLREGGIDTETFDNRGAKTLKDLFIEIQSREVDLMLRLHEQKMRPARFAKSSKVLIRTKAECLVETHRIYPNGLRVEKTIGGTNGSLPSRWTVSETATKDETPLQTILRGLWQELKFDLMSPKELLRVPPHTLFDVHESSVYPGLLTVNLTTWFEWLIKERFGDDTMVIEDYGVFNHLAWIPY